MIKVSFFETNGTVERVRAVGHSGYAESGSDVVCAAVSTLVQTAYLAIKELGCDASYVRDEKTGLFEFTVKADGQKRHDADVILHALGVGLRDLESGYGEYVGLETNNGGKR